MVPSGKEMSVTETGLGFCLGVLANDPREIPSMALDKKGVIRGGLGPDPKADNHTNEWLGE